MALSPRKRGQAAVRARHSTFTRNVFARLEPFFAVEEVSGGPLLIATLIGLLWINSPFSDSYGAVWNTKLGITVASLKLEKTFAEWARDALLPVFFFGVGIEVKRELVKGLLSNRRTAMLPLFCALGGMIVPAACYIALNLGGKGAHGWGATVTTDTAFALALVGMFARQLPRSVRVLLLAFAAVDDIGGLLVIAIVYTSHVVWLYLAIAAVLFGCIIALQRFEIIASIPYVLLGIAILLLVEESGVHATIAGVMLGTLIPVYPRVPEHHFAKVVQKQVDGFQRAHERAESADPAQESDEKQEAVDHQEARLGQLSETAHATYEAAQRVTHGINPWISYVVLPLFAMSNVGVHFSGDVLRDALTHAVAPGIVLALVVGKPVGVLLFAYGAIRSGMARMPDGMTWPTMIAVAVSSGIGFTISLFIADLAFANGEAADAAKLGVLVASVLSGVAGYLAFRWAAGRPAQRRGGSGHRQPRRDASGPLAGAAGARGVNGTRRALGARDGDDVQDTDKDAAHER